MHLYSGATGVLLYTLSSPNEEQAGNFGFSVAGIPDTDGDGRGDLLIGAPNEDVGMSPEGAGSAYLFSGATGAILHELRSPREENGGRFGFSVAGVPDATGDGRDDLLIGARDESLSASLHNAGRAYLFSGADGALVTELRSPDAESNGEFGQSVAGVPDATGDGLGDLLVGAYREDYELPGFSVFDAGEAYLFSGASDALITKLTALYPELPNAYFGHAVAGVPDADGDGRGDLLVGTYREGAGAIYLFSGATGARIFNLRSPHPETNGWFGWSVAGVPDADGDGQGDLLVGAIGEEPSGSPDGAGRAYLFSGATGSVLVELQSPNENEGGSFGFSVAGVPNADGVGGVDILIGAPFEGPNGGPAEVGRAYLFSTAAGTDGAPVPPALSLLSAYPNPFHSQTTLRFTLPVPGPVRLTVYDVLGREVARLADGYAEGGEHVATFDGSALPAGVYVWHLESETRVRTGRLVLAH